MNRMSVLISVCVATLVFSVSGTLRAAVPTVLHYQGVLTDGGGTPISTNTSVDFTLWSAPIGGTVRWTETRNVTPDNEGRFSILLGQAVPLHDSVFKMPPLYLGTQVGADPEMTPRQLLSSNAFAFRISTVDGATGGNIVGGVEVLTSGTGSGLGVRDPGGNIGSMSSTSSVFADVNSDTIAQLGAPGLRFIEPSTGDTIFEYDPDLNSVEIGLGNDVSGSESIAIGTGNTVSGLRSFAVGSGNTVSLHNSFAVGTNNRAEGVNSIAGGAANLASEYSSGVLCGSFNHATAVGAVVGGGSFNKSRGSYSFVGGGGSSLEADSNVASGNQAAILGGAGNTADGRYACVVGGQRNYAGEWSIVGGGQDNTAMGELSCVPGGKLNQAVGTGAFAAGVQAEAIFPGTFVWSDASGGGSFTATGFNQFLVRASGGVGIGTNAPAHPLHMASGAHCTAGGTWTNASDRELKENFRLVSSESLLEKIAGIPITEWNYRIEDPSIRHIGAMAQDFHAAFGVGESDKTITTIDADGVLMAAVQALHKRNLELEAQIEELRNLIKSKP